MGINVLSLFDGISCGQIALERLGIEVDNYFASEIDTKSIKVTQCNYPKTIQLGDVRNIHGSDLPKIDLLLGGSPCQGFSFAGKQLNFNDPRSKLVFEFFRILKETNPKFWLLENVDMKKEYQNIISKELGVEPVKINSSLVSAQNRVRLYWANFKITQPKDKRITLKDIIEFDEDKHLNSATIVRRRVNDEGIRKDFNKNIPISRLLEIREINTDKCNCLTTVQNYVLTPLPIGRHRFNKDIPFRYYTLKEYCRLQTVPENYFDNIVSESAAKKMLGNAWTVDVIVHILNNIDWK